MHVGRCVMQCRTKLAVLALYIVAACSSEISTPPPPEGSSAGVTYSFPSANQLDIPVSTTITIAFSEAIDDSLLDQTCSVSGGAMSAGGVCVVGPDGLLDGTLSLVGGSGKAVEFVPNKLMAGQSYSVYVSPSILPGNPAKNIPSDAPLFQFTTRTDRIVVGTPATVISVNGSPSATFISGSTTQPRFPLVDFATFRLVFSEPIDERTAVIGTGVEFVEVLENGEEVAVPGQLLARGIHLSFDPDDDLSGGHLYRLRLGSSLRDLAGEDFTPITFEFSPRPTTVDGEGLYPQTYKVSSGAGNEGWVHPFSASDNNSVRISEQIIGDNVIHLQDGLLAAQMAHADGYAHEIPFVIRKGQALASDSMTIALGGVVPAGLQTGDMSMSFASDVTGVLVRNGYWPIDTRPENTYSPLEVHLDFDLALSSSNAIGNAVLTQTVLGVHLSGLAQVQDGTLVIHNLGVMELDILGIATGSVQLSLALSSAVGESAPLDLSPPTLVSTSPAPTDLLEPGDSIHLKFSESVQLLGDTAVELRTSSDTAVPADIRTDGAMVIITPSARLGRSEEFQVVIGAGLRDLTGNTWQAEAMDPTAGGDRWKFRTPAAPTGSEVAPTIMAAFPGAPCALSSSGSCQGGEGGDEKYRAFELAANKNIEVAFDQPMNAMTLVAGTTCDSGAIRVEEVSGTNCTAVVPGYVLVRERGIRFVPAQPWRAGQTYRLRLHSGDNKTCDSGELCGRNGHPLNTAPLKSIGKRGGPDVDIEFVGTDETAERVLLVSAHPIVDVNGNGRVDGGESKPETNRAALHITDHGGTVTDAKIDMPDCIPSTPRKEGCMYLGADMIVSLGEQQDSCSFETGQGTTTAAHCVPVNLAPSAIYTTGLLLDVEAVWGLVELDKINTGKNILRLREGNAPITGHIVESPDGNAEMYVALDMYLDAPDLEIDLLGGLLSLDHDMHSKPMKAYMRGPIEFMDDGRMRVSLASETPTQIVVTTDALGLDGTIDLEIAAGAMSMTLMSHPARGGQR